MRDYYRMLSGLDHMVAQVLEGLRQQGLLDDTIVVYASDNGCYLGDRGFADKWTPGAAMVAGESGWVQASRRLHPGERAMRTHGRWWFAAAVGALLCGLVPVAMAASVGMVKTSAGDVRIERKGVMLPAPVGTRVEAADVVRTGKNGSAGISFADQSRLSLGPNSVLAIDRFDFDPTTHEGAFDSTLRRGTLSAVSGKLAHQSPKAMTVRTRSTLLAVRGTEFVVSVR